jgi:hypothetical protein
MSGETFDVGLDTGSPVGGYPNKFRFTGGVERIGVTLRPGAPYQDDVAGG